MEPMEDRIQVVREDCARIIGSLEERAARAVWKKVREAAERQPAAEGTAEIGRYVEVASCTEIRFWEANGPEDCETRDTITRLLREAGLKTAGPRAVEGEPFTIEFPLYGSTWMKPGKSGVSRFSYVPCENLRAITARVDALAAREGFRLTYEAAGGWLRVSAAPERRLLGDEGETAVEDVYSRFIFVRREPGGEPGGAPEEKGETVPKLRFRIRYRRAGGEGAEG